MSINSVSNFFGCLPLIGIPVLYKKMSNEVVYHWILGETEYVPDPTKEESRIYEPIKDDISAKKALIKKYQANVICATVQGILTVIMGIAIAILGINFGGVAALAAILSLGGLAMTCYGGYSIWKAHKFLSEN